MTLELLIRQPGERRENTVVLLPQAPGSGADVIARSLADSLDEGHWRLLPAPSTEAGVLVQRAWHRDAWLAMPTSEQGSVALVTGPTAAYLAPVLADAARTVVLVRGPLAAMGMTDELPERSALERLTEAPASDIPPALGRIANPQSRALLAPWHDPSELVVSPGPPNDADRWREALFGDVLPHLDAAVTEHAPTVARELVGSLGGRPKPVIRAAKAVVDGAVDSPRDPVQAELLLRLNWLDAELYDHCVGPTQVD
jgi:hypothetical protein